MSAANFSTGSVVKYALLPRFLPRFSALFLSGFNQIAYLMAQIYQGVRLLPPNHPYLRAENIGKFGIRQVIAAAANHIEFRRENIDQIIVFVAMLLGMALLVMQVFLLFIGILAPSAIAGAMTPLSFGYYFGTPAYGGLGSAQDLAFILLDRVFGVEDIFDSCVSTGVPCAGTMPNLTFDNVNTVYAPAAFPWPYHLGLHAMLEFYSLGLLVVACFIILYFIIVIVAETAQTGTPFGKRFNSVWAPLRLVMALGLLIPITSGLNSAQFITLWMAKFGSNFASNGWILFNAGVASWGATQATALIAKPQTPEVTGLLQFMMLAHACKALEEGYIIGPRPVNAGAGATACGLPVMDDGIAGFNPATDPPENIIDGYLVKFDPTGANDSVRLSETAAMAARGFFNNGDMTIRFGDRDCSYTGERGRTFPTCGEIVIPVTNPSDDPSEIGSTSAQIDYYELVRYLWGRYPGASTALASRWGEQEFCERVRADLFVPGGANGDMDIRRKALAFVQTGICKIGNNQPRLWGAGQYNVVAGDFYPMPDEDWGTEIERHYKEGAGAMTAISPALVAANGAYPGAVQYSNMSGTSVIAENIIRTATTAQISAIASGLYELPMDQLARGWAGAGMWYNHIARLNGGITSSIWNYPQASRYPDIMESVLAKVRQNNQTFTPANQFNPNQGNGFSIQLKRPNETKAAEVLNGVYKYWGNNRAIEKPNTGNALFDFINWLFGTKGLFSLDDPQNATVSPLALLSSLGKSLVEASIRNIGLGVGAKGGAALAGAGGMIFGEAAGDAIATFLFSIATATLTAGIVLYYILPFLPFVYFFFAVGNWIKGIFEAMVGVPLWALAHIRIDGNGLPGEAAMNGYYMLFEIFLRPILILFGLLAAVSIFQAMATVLNGIWPIATKNLGGTNYDLQANAGWLESARGPIDQLFFTVMYAVILYIMALSSFKLIDLIPNQIMRWLGTGVSTFSDLTQDAAANLTQYTSVIGSQMSSQAIGGISSAMDGMKNIGKGMGNQVPP